MKVVRIKNFLAVVAEDEWTAVRAARALRRNGAHGTGLPEQNKLAATLRAIPFNHRSGAGEQRRCRSPHPAGAKTLKASYFWPMQSHASIGPSCAVADVRADAATVWTASQGTHGNRNTFAASSDCRGKKCG